MIRALLFAPILFLLVLFALSNRDNVSVRMWPTDLVIDMPMSIMILLAMTVAFLLGAVMLWIPAIAARLRARRAEHSVRMLEAQVAELKARLMVPVSPDHFGPALPPPA